MNETFKQGDDVVGVTTGTSYVVDGGPFDTGRGPFYVVRQPHLDVHRIVTATEIRRPIPAFEVGGTADWEDDRLTLIAGPFKYGAAPWWVTEDAHGHQDKTYVHEMENYRPPAPAPETFEYEGVTYEVGATYTDKDGDRWTLEELPKDEDTEEVWRMEGRGYRSLGSTFDLIQAFGPLRRVES